MPPDQKTKPDVWYAEGVRFQCQGSGKCCVSHGEFGFVYLTQKDRKNMATHLGMSTREFMAEHCEKTDGVWHLKENKDNQDCRFLEGKKCGVYEARPIQCRTWPFWPELMSAKAWKRDVVAFCPGVGKGPLISRDQIEATLNEQCFSETELFGDAAQAWADKK